MPTRMPPTKATSFGPKRSTSQPSIGTSQVSVSTKIVNATWIEARPQWYFWSMGLTNSVHPYCRLAIITMQTMPKSNWTRRTAGVAAAAGAPACNSFTALSVKKTSGLTTWGMALKTCRAGSVGHRPTGPGSRGLLSTAPLLGCGNARAITQSQAPPRARLQVGAAAVIGGSGQGLPLGHILGFDRSAIFPRLCRVLLGSICRVVGPVFERHGSGYPLKCFEFGELGVERLAVLRIFRVDPGPTSLQPSYDLVNVVGRQIPHRGRSRVGAI